MNDPLFPVANFWNPIARCPYFPLGSRRSIVTQVGRSDVLMKTNGNMTGNPNHHLVPPCWLLSTKARPTFCVIGGGRNHWAATRVYNSFKLTFDIIYIT